MDISAPTISLSAITVLCVDEIPTTLIVPLAFCSESRRADSSSVIEECLLLLQTLALKLKGAADGINHQICFLTRNAEEPWLDNTEEGPDIATNECSSLVGAGIWGMVRSDSLKIDPDILRLVYIDADYFRSDMNGLKQVLHEFRGIADSTLLELEVSYRDNA